MTKKKGAYKKSHKGDVSPRQEKQIQWETVTCPTCGNGTLRNLRNCGLCKGTGEIKTIK